MTGSLCRFSRKVFVVGLALTGFLLGAPRHAWSQG